MNNTVLVRREQSHEHAIIEEAKRLYGIGLCPIPVRYVGDKCIPPKGLSVSKFDTWAAVQSIFDRMDVIDALGVWIGPNKQRVVWLDIDSLSERDGWLKRASHIVSHLPRVRTRRGMHVVCRLAEPIQSRLDLRPYGFEIDLLYGPKQIVIVPPSTHRNDNQLTYQWEVELPDALSKIPVLPLRELVPILTEKQNQKLWKAHVKKPRENTNCYPLDPSLPKASPARVLDRSLDVGLGKDVPTSIRLSIERSMPTTTGQTRKMLPSYVRSLMHVRTDWTMSQIREAAILWWECARGRGVTREPMHGVIDLVCRLFNNYDSSIGGALIDANLFADTATGELFETMFHGRKNIRALSRLAWFCYGLSLPHERSEFFLSCFDAGKAVNTTAKNPKTTGKRLLDTLVTKGVIRMVTPGEPIRGGKATVYRFTEVVDLPPRRKFTLTTTNHEQNNTGSRAIDEDTECIAVAN